MSNTLFTIADKANAHDLVCDYSDILSIGGIYLEKEARCVKAFGRPVSLTPSEFDLLSALMSAPGCVFSRSELLLKLQDANLEGVERMIDVHICNLRMKIEPNSSDPIYIKTVFRAGYQFSLE
jgi:DNA-binding response OmpR family regulator